jgi:hypothetical protein
MTVSVDQEAQRAYVHSLRWRQNDLQRKIETIGRQIAAWTKDEAELKQQLRAVEQLLSAEGEPPADPGRAMASVVVGTDDSVGGNERGPEPSHPPMTFAQWGPKSRAIYTAAAAAIQEAGVPLHYRVLAEEVQKHVVLSGVDPGATLIAHLHRAQDFFPRVGRGIYGLQGVVAIAQPDQLATPAPAARRRKTRRRTR